jgi:AcrR family transcriptional regulator
VTGARAVDGRPDDGRRTSLIDAAVRVVARDGFAAATTRRIAAEAQLPLGLVHYWFAGKDELVEQVVTNLLDELAAAAAVGAAALPHDATDTPAEDVLRQFRAVFDVVINDEPGRQLSMYELTVMALRAPELRDSARRQYAAYRETAAVATAGWFDRVDVELPGPPEALARFIATLFDGVTLAWLADPEGTRPDEIFAFVSALLTGYRPTEVPRPA